MTHSSKIKDITKEINKVITGKDEAIKLLLTALVTSGHVLIEDVPGVGKTTLARALGKATGLSYKRAQFTPDVTAADITGFVMYNKSKENFVYRPGMIMCNLFLADEINRTPPKTQSALLEAMEEQGVTVEGKTYPLPDPFIVIATQNELGYVGTYPLPEAQLDRFMIKISLGYPSPEDEVKIIALRQKSDPVDDINSVCTAEEISACRNEVKQVNIEPEIHSYIVKLTSATRTHYAIELGASPRASLLLMRASQGVAFIGGRVYVTPEDVYRIAPHVLPHRILLSQEAKVRRLSAKDIINEILRSVPVPLRGKPL
jgi:MoxR-like ATPase